MSSPADDPAQVWASRSHPVQEDIEFQRATWRAERCGWLLLCGVVGLALMGLFANGPLSSATATGAAGRLQVEYGRFERNGAATSMQLRVGAEPRDIILRIDSAFMAAFQIEALSPQPMEERSGPDGVEMVFRATDNGPLHVHLALRPENVGLVRSEIGIAGEPPARFTQLIFP